MFGVCKKKGSGQPSTLANACQCNPKIAYDSDKFPYKDFPPPQPPNGRDDLWELQFCRWWGWNWVRKKEIEGMTSPTMVYGAKIENCPAQQMNNDPCIRTPRYARSSKKNCQCYKTRTWGQPNSPLPTKRELKDLCKCLIFQKPSRELPPPELQNLYNTPSHSVVVERERYSFNHLNQNTGFGHGCLPKPSYHKESRRRKQCSAPSWCNKPKQSSSSEEIICTQQLAQPCNISTQCQCRPSTDESMEYLTVRMQHVKSDTHCPCHSHASKKRSVQLTETQTIPCAPVMQDFGCQCTVPPLPVRPPSKPCMCSNEEQVIKYKGKKKKTLCICVCCCNCCKKDEKEKSQNSDSTPKKESSIKLNKMKNVDSNSNMKGSSGTDIKPNVSYQENGFITMPMSYNIQPTSTKQFSKFGNPSQNYPWLNSSFSNQSPISMLNNDSFTSPISGKTYNFAALQFSTNEHTPLPNLLDATEDLEYLKSIQSSIKNETEQKIIFDAVCDALLSEPNTEDQPDKLFNEFSSFDNAKDFSFTSEFPDLFQWSALNKPSESDNKILGRSTQNVQSNKFSFEFKPTSFSKSAICNEPSQIDNKIVCGYTRSVPVKDQSKFNFEFKPTVSKPSMCGKPTEQNCGVGEIQANIIQTYSPQKDSGFKQPISKDSLETSDEKENFARSEISTLIEQVLLSNTTTDTKCLGNESQIATANLISLTEADKDQTKLSEISQKLRPCESYRKFLKTDVASLVEKPDFSKTGLLSAERTKIISKKIKRALSTPSEYVTPKKYKPDKKLSFDYKRMKSRIFAENLIPEINLGESYTDEAVKRTESTQNLKKSSSLERVRSSLDIILAKINKIVQNVKSKNGKNPLDLSFLSEKSEPILKNDQLNVDSIKFGSQKMSTFDVKTADSKMKSYEAFSYGVESNRSGMSSKNEILSKNISERDIVKINDIKLDSGFKRTSTADIKLESKFSKTSTANSAFEGKYSVTLGTGRKKKYAGKKSLIPVRRKLKN